MQLRCGSVVLDLTRPRVMGILNVTPDSFSDGGRFASVDRAVAHGLAMAEEGADFIDVGGESTRPGATPVPLEEELRRVVPVVEQLRTLTGAVISVDTSKPQVMQAAAAAGAGLINDVRALSMPGALAAAAATDCAVCLMHMRGEPATMQHAPTYGDVVSEVKAFLRERAQACLSGGIAAERVVLDPGFGFGKTLAHNLEIVRRLPELAELGRPLLVGVSRKSSIAALTGRPQGERLYGSLALGLIAVRNGARIIRVHDVAAMVDVLNVARAVNDGWVPPGAADRLRGD
jgi:dihydropteroate synthase